MFRRLIAGLVVAGLAVGVWLLWPEGEPPVSTITAAATPTTVRATPTSSAPPAVTPDPSTTSTTEDTHVVETTEQAEAILRELWFGWFEGIYYQDEDRIREVVATEEYLTAGVAAFSTLVFVEPPDPDGVVFVSIEILRSDNQCVAVWSESNVTFLEPGPSRVGVDILRWVDGEWRLTSSWANRADLWEADCEALLQP